MRVYTIPQTAPFLDHLARAVLDGTLPVPGSRPPARTELPRWTILLPTRRACRALRDAFLHASGGGAMLLPRIRPIGDVEEDTLDLGDLAELPWSGSAEAALPPAIEGLDRQLLLTGLVRVWSDQRRQALQAVWHSSEPFLPLLQDTAAAAALARELARLMDQADTEEVLLDAVADLAEDRFEAHWQHTVTFLKIITRHWPEHLGEKGCMSPMARRSALIRAEAAILAERAADAPVIAAGSTGSIPATAELLRVLASAPLGAVALPGLDHALDGESWDHISRHPEHPQFGLRELLGRLGVARADVATLPGSEPDGPARARLSLISEMMRPAETTERWAAADTDTDQEVVASGLSGMRVLEAPSLQHEAEAIALLLREALEHDGRSAALVTPERKLARLVAAALRRWSIEVDDSAGLAVLRTPPGVLLDLGLAVVEASFSPVALLALLKHPLCRLRWPAARVRGAARALELACLRGLAPEPGLAGVRASLEAARQSTGAAGRQAMKVADGLSDEDWSDAAEVLDRLERALGELVEHYESSDQHALADIARVHVAALEALASQEAADGASVLWSGEAGEALAAFFNELLTIDGAAMALPGRDYPALCRELLGGRVVRPVRSRHTRLSILGSLEARLLHTDTLILAGLNEGVWPAATEPGPWLSRPMRTELGLPPPERQVGLAAHDLAQGLGARRIVLTRATKVDGVPTVASRWLNRLKAYLTAKGLENRLDPDEETPWLAWARLRDRADDLHAKTAVEGPPCPAPPIEARPRRLSVTRIEAWLRNPYEIFARDILRLYRLDPLEKLPDAALRGQLVHAAMAGFTRAHGRDLPPDIAAELLNHARDFRAALELHPGLAAIWQPRFERFARWFAETEPDLRAGIAESAAEIDGGLELCFAGAPFLLTARADRIDLSKNGEMIVTDYKTGSPPTKTDVAAGWAPQLPLEAAIARAGGFEGIPPGDVQALRYIHVRGGRKPGEIKDVTGDANELADQALAGLERLLADFADPNQAYEAKRRAGAHYRYDDYAHLARVASWASRRGDDD